MSEENVELARRALEALDRRDLSSWLAVNDEDSEVVPTRDWPEPGVRGAEAAFNWYVKAFDTLQPFRTADNRKQPGLIGIQRPRQTPRFWLRSGESGLSVREAPTGIEPV